jgi:3-deoxy-D-manno-octulosonate 8-phosphate phosphatase (KDO 8-P phosphatase)
MLAKSPTKTPPKIFISDVDGVMTDGKFYYTNEGKVMKVFGSDDHDALCLLKPYMQILFVTGDHRGFDISKKRIVDDMKMQLELVSTTQRLSWIRERFKPEEVAYMGDGIFDHYVMREVGYAIATANADSNAKKAAHFVTERTGGDRAVSEACLHILKKFFEAYRPEYPLPHTKFSGTWAGKSISTQ